MTTNTESRLPFAELHQLGRTLWSWRRFLLLNVGAITVLALIISLVLPKWYQATTTLLPPQEEDAGFSVTTMLRGLTIPGVRIPTQASPAEVFVAILQSRTIHTAIIEEFGYKEIYGQKRTEDAVRDLRQHLNANISEDGLIVLSFEDRDPERAAAVANRMVELLDDFNRHTRSNRGRKARLFIEDRLAETQRRLAEAEDSLRSYQQVHRSLLLSPEEAGSAELGARLVSERIALEVRLGLTESYAAQGSPEVSRLRARLAEIDQQIRRLPALGLEIARRYREVKIQEQVFALLTAQLEEARITEAKDVATVELLDPAIPPERKSRPKRLIIVLVGFVGSLVLGIGYVLVADTVHRAYRAD